MVTFVHGPWALVAASFAFTSVLHLAGRFQEHPPPSSSGASVEQAEIPAGSPTDLDGYTAAARDDAIVALPGLAYDPGFRQFSGYLTVDAARGRRLFYWYVESQGDPAADPVVLWTNGGPACSGLLGFGTEMGPYRVDRDGALTPNPFSWNAAASMLYVEQPAGTGFSYSDSPADYATGDARAAADNYRLVLEFFQRFPERRANPFYIASESYGGHYMPQLTLQILERDRAREINFQGMLVGNPYVDPFSNTVTEVQAYYAHGVLAKPLFDRWSERCATPATYASEACQREHWAMYRGLRDKINPYALDYPVCLEEEATTSRRRLHAATSSQVHQLLRHSNSSAGAPPLPPPAGAYHPCAEEHLTAYLNRADVQEALHVHTDKVAAWEVCTDAVDYSEADRDASLVDLYADVVRRAAVERGLQVFVFSGDDDSVCSTAGTQAWIYDLGYNATDGGLWRSWDVEGQVAGFVTEFDLGADAAGSFVFVTVHGAGHEVPAYRPREALAMFRKVLSKEW